MASIRLNTHMRTVIRRRMLKHRYSGDLEALIEEGVALAGDIYNDLFPSHVQAKMQALPNGWLPEADSMYVKFGASFDHIQFNGWRHWRCEITLIDQPKAIKKLVPFDKKDGCVNVYDAGTSICTRYEIWRGHHKELDEAVSSAARKLTAALASVTTVARLLEEWPEARNFCTGIELPPQLPAIRPEQLNELLNLKPLAA